MRRLGQAANERAYYNSLPEVGSARLESNQGPPAAAGSDQVCQRV
jgi:hypothetical protein